MSVGPDGFGGGIESVGVAIADHQVGAEVGQGESSGFTNALGGARHERDAAGQEGGGGVEGHGAAGYSPSRGDLVGVEGKRVLVTGASSGIGAALAVGFAEAGATVGICARRGAELAETLARCRDAAPDSQMWAIDLADLDELDEFAATVVDELDGLDVLVNNAGIPKRRDVRELTFAEVEAVMRINYLSPIRLTLALLPELIARQGHIVNVSSVAARLGPPFEAAYSASKGALTAWSESMRVDLSVADTGVGVHVLNPGVIDTPLFQMPDNDPSIADLEALPPEAVVAPVLAALESGQFEVNVPEWFGDVYHGKFADTTAFLDGSIAWTRQRLAEM